MKMIEKLKRILEEDHYWCDYGICYELAWCDDHDKVSLCKIFRRWDEFSGNVEFPVPGLGYDDEDDAFTQCDNGMFNPETEYGQSRLRLTRFILEQLEQNKNEPVD